MVKSSVINNVFYTSLIRVRIAVQKFIKTIVQKFIIAIYILRKLCDHKGVEILEANACKDHIICL